MPHPAQLPRSTFVKKLQQYVPSTRWTIVFVWIVSAMTVTKVVEGCVYIRRRYYGILLRVGGEFEHSALSPLSLRPLSHALSSNATTLTSDCGAVRASRFGSNEQGCGAWCTCTAVVADDQEQTRPCTSKTNEKTKRTRPYVVGLLK